MGRALIRGDGVETQAQQVGLINQLIARLPTKQGRRSIKLTLGLYGGEIVEGKTGAKQAKEEKVAGEGE